MRGRILLVLLALLCLPAAALGASFEIVEYTVAIEVGGDGAGWFSETLVYEFDDAYNGILATIRHDDVLRLDDLRLFVDGDTPLARVDALDGVPYTYTAEEEGHSTSIRVFAPGGAGERTFRIEYRVGGLAQRYRDTARINHVLLYSDAVYAQASFSIALPGRDDTQILPFVHGGVIPEDRIALERGVLTLGPARVERGAVIEIQVLFPEDWLPDARMVDADMRGEALAIEARIEAELAEQAAREERVARIIVYATLAALAVYAVGFFALFLSMRRKYGLKHPILPTTDDALLTDMTAAEAEALKTGAVSSSALSATLLELAGREVLTMEADASDTCFTYAWRPDDLAPHQAMLLDWLFADRDTLCVSALDAGDDHKAAEAFVNQYNAWKTRVQMDVRARRWVFANDNGRWGALLGALLAGLVIAAFLLRYGLWPLAIPAVLMTVLLAVAFGRIRRLTDDGEARVAAMDGFIANYQDRLETNPGAILGRTPLLMALGYIQPLADWIDQHPDRAQEAAAFETTAPYWAFAGWHHSMLHMDRQVREAQSHNAGTHSGGQGGGSSGTGGFSGGSGGSSHGAW